jgi:hypothetical protein
MEILSFLQQIFLEPFKISDILGNRKYPDRGIFPADWPFLKEKPDRMRAESSA